jgi:hypothetical protein
MRLKKYKVSKKFQIKVGANIVGAGLGALIAGPAGAIIGSVISPITEEVLSRALSVKEKSRVEKIKSYAISEIDRKIRSGSTPKKDFDFQKASELFEGVLLKAKSTYEEKKLPYIANLFAVAPFTNTPIENINQSLITAEQLSYRQLCLLEIINKTQFSNLSLSDKPLRDEVPKINDEKFSGVYQDLVGLILLGLIGQTPMSNYIGSFNNYAGFIIPAELFLYYPGRLLCNGMQLANIPEVEISPLIKILKPL